MKARWLPWGLALGCGSLFTGAAYADGMRCGSRLVFEGDSMYEVKSTCGEPDAVSQRVEYRTVRRFVAGPCVSHQGRTVCGHVEEVTVPVTIDEWVYDFGSTSFIRYALFEQGKLVDVKLGDYGHK